MTPTTPIKLRIFINDKAYDVHDADQTAAALLRLAGGDPKIFDLFLVKKNGVEEKVKDGQIINLKDSERFRSRQLVRFSIDGEPFRTYDEDQAAAELLRMAGMDPGSYDLARGAAPASFPDDESGTSPDGAEFVPATHVGGVA